MSPGETWGDSNDIVKKIREKSLIFSFSGIKPGSQAYILIHTVFKKWDKVPRQ
jgi:hypothetical protein